VRIVLVTSLFALLFLIFLMSVIKVTSLYKRYMKAKDNAVNGISFSVPEGAFFALLGPNGAGKTTTVSLLTTTLEKTSGEVHIAGYNLDTHASDIRAHIGVIFQGPSLDINLTSEENIRFHALLYGLYSYRPLYSLMPKAYKSRVSELADILDIKDAIFKPIHELSGGMKRKLEILRSLMHKPRVLFLDEPTTGLDPVSRKSLWDYLKVVRKEEQMTVFLTTHYLEEADGADHVGIINHGDLVHYGTPRALKKELVRDTIVLSADGSAREALRSELRAMNLSFEESDGAPFTITLTSNLRAQKIIHDIQTPLSVLEVERPTLEQAYLEVIWNGDKNQE
jgi:ABC-2 type transport system ATP-binding protein